MNVPASGKSRILSAPKKAEKSRHPLAAKPSPARLPKPSRTSARREGLIFRVTEGVILGEVAPQELDLGREGRRAVVARLARHVREVDAADREPSASLGGWL